ncbi:hypothetical protein TREES_T100003141 [Tupaia chinensis]|uniref:Uncharacterized protein n=1 Tax=Tupaia chinensis TaxID=246437 RepID=L9KMD8_TUPCH|nr:hypothetical protein TREES_T100003141 [Tupaia chinensis]
MEPSIFPMQKGSLHLLRQKWESSDNQKSECCSGGHHCRFFQSRESKLLEPEVETVSALKSPDPPSLPYSTMEEMMTTEPENKVPEGKSDNFREYSQPEVLKEESLGGRRRIERFSIALDELRSVFESPRSGNRPVGTAEYGQKINYA